jgi:hypothetical protein
MQRSTIVGVSVALAVTLMMLVFPAERGPALANEPAPRGGASETSFEDTYAGWSRERLLATLEKRKSAALALKNEGNDAELDRLVDEIEWLTAATHSSSGP